MRLTRAIVVTALVSLTPEVRSAELPLTMGADIPLNAPVSRGFPGEQFRPIVGASDRAFLVVFWQRRFLPLRPASETDGLFGVRLDDGGALLDQVPFQISAGPISNGDAHGQVAVSWNGSNYLVVYSSHSNPGLLAALVSPAGQVVARDIVVDDSQMFHESADLDWDGEHHLVVWVSNGRASGLRINPDGRAVDAKVIDLLPMHGTADVHVVWDGLQHVVTAAGGAGIRVGKDGTLATPAPLPDVRSDVEISSAVAGGTAYAFWRTDDSSGSSLIQGLALRPDGQVAAPQAVVATPGVSGRPLAAGAGSRFLITFATRAPGSTSGADVALATWTPGAPATVTTISTAPGDEQDPAIACGASRCLAVWSDGREAEPPFEGGRQVRASLLSTDGSPAGPAAVLLSTVEAAQRWPQVCWSGDHYVAVWEEHRVFKDSPDLHAQNLSADGQPMNAPYPVVVAPGRQRLLQVACAAGATAVLWEQLVSSESGAPVPRPISLTVVARDGRPAPAVKVLEPNLANNEHAPMLGLASDGPSFLLAWPAAGQVRAAAFDLTGRRTTQETPLGNVVLPIRIDAYWTGQQYLVTWFDPQQFWVTPVGRDGAPRGAAVAVPDVRPSFHGISGGGRVALGWSPGTLPVSLQGKLLDANGRVTASWTVAMPELPYPSLRLAWDGRSFVALLSGFDESPTDGTGRLTMSAKLLRLGADGTMLDAKPIAVLDHERVENLAFSGGTDGRSLLLRNLLVDPGRADADERLVGRLLTSGVPDSGSAGETTKDGGCGCALGARSRPDASHWWTLIFAALLGARRRADRPGRVRGGHRR